MSPCRVVTAESVTAQLRSAAQSLAPCRRWAQRFNGSPAVWLDVGDGSIVIQGWKIADERTMSEITAAKPVPDHETVVRVPARMAAFLMEACGGGTTGV